MNQNNSSFTEDLELEKLKHDAKQGKAKAQFDLGRKYAEGDGVDQNNVQAYAWLTLAYTQGKKDAVEYVEKLEMTPDQVTQAQNLSKTLLEQDIGISELIQKVRSELEEVQQDLIENNKIAMFRATHFELDCISACRGQKHSVAA